MSGAIGAVLGLVEIAVGAVFFAEGGEFLISAGVAQLLGYAASLLANPRKTPLIPIGAAYAGTMEPRRIIYGLMKTSGMYTCPPMTFGPNNDYLALVLTVCGHSGTDAQQLYIAATRPC
jgi:hypothetical protein